ncbi:MAG: tetratricopeptide repeat protein [Ruminococcus sp.]|nr:tetratricopeptide repeat protein [Ruminococcus sp.]MCD7811843.1 tetratricopeptide repeat protein [Ruminococcus sp.]
MEYNEILDSLRAKLTGETYEENAAILREEGLKYGKVGDYDGVKAVGELMLELMPESEKEEIKRLTHLDGIRLDEYYKNIVKLINEKNTIEAKPLAEKLYRKITEEYREGETAKFVSLRNPFEDNLYQHLFENTKTLNRAPFDFATYITAYGYLLVDSGSPLDAIPVLEKAIEYNPVDCGPKFELAEVYKVLKNKAQLIKLTKETLHVASSPIAIARCYANMGYMCVDFGELDDAVAFYTASVMMAPNPAIPHELRGIAQMKGKEIKQPTADEINEAFEKYGLEFGPDKEVISVAAYLGSYYLNKKDIPNALKALKIVYNLTRDEEIKKIILKYEPDARQVMPDGTPVSGKPNITRTVNNNPEE